MRIRTTRSDWDLERDLMANRDSLMGGLTLLVSDYSFHGICTAIASSYISMRGGLRKIFWFYYRDRAGRYSIPDKYFKFAPGGIHRAEGRE